MPYPDELDEFTNPIQGQSRAAAGVQEWVLFSQLNDAVEAIETELGVLPKGDYDSVAERLDNAGSSPLTSDPFVVQSAAVAPTNQLVVDVDGARIVSFDEDEITVAAVTVDQSGNVVISGTNFVGMDSTANLEITATSGYLFVNSMELGFFGTTPVVQPVGVGVDAASIHAALVALGLIAA